MIKRSQLSITMTRGYQPYQPWFVRFDHCKPLEIVQLFNYISLLLVTLACHHQPVSTITKHHSTPSFSKVTSNHSPLPTKVNHSQYNMKYAYNHDQIWLTSTHSSPLNIINSGYPFSAPRSFGFPAAPFRFSSRTSSCAWRRHRNQQ